MRAREIFWMIPIVIWFCTHKKKENIKLRGICERLSTKICQKFVRKTNSSCPFIFQLTNTTNGTTFSFTLSPMKYVYIGKMHSNVYIWHLDVLVWARTHACNERWNCHCSTFFALAFPMHSNCQIKWKNGQIDIRIPKPHQITIFNARFTIDPNYFGCRNQIKTTFIVEMSRVRATSNVILSHSKIVWLWRHGMSIK